MWSYMPGPSTAAVRSRISRGALNYEYYHSNCTVVVQRRFTSNLYLPGTSFSPVEFNRGCWKVVLNRLSVLSSTPKNDQLHRRLSYVALHARTIYSSARSDIRRRIEIRVLLKHRQYRVSEVFYFECMCTKLNRISITKAPDESVSRTTQLPKLSCNHSFDPTQSRRFSLDWKKKTYSEARNLLKKSEI